ncbi:MAG: peptide chain release factor 1, partial [Acidimicrobiaceae bacterium]|nr:peptide chain release factor 1 [Acidimicrobiaceae bacterium]
MLDRLQGLEDEYDAVLRQLSDPAVLTDQNALRDASRRHKALEPIVAAHHAYRRALDDLATAKEMLPDAEGDDREMLRAEVDAAEAAIARVEEELKVLLLPKDVNDGKNVILEIRGAEGGEEANLFAKVLFEMYLHYAEHHGLKIEILGSDGSDMGGFNEVTFMVKGKTAWSHFKYEGGPHRVQRVPVTESQ